jgi:uncharacterized RDD family membrane protein YckC
VIDSIARVVTPEGNYFDLYPAGLISRLLALLLDTLLQSLILLVAGIAVFALGVKGDWELALLGFADVWFYMVAFEVLADGRTPGKRALGLQVVCRDGTAPSVGASLLRNLLRFADYLCLLGVFVPLLMPGFRRIGDLAAGTYVIYLPKQANRWSSSEPASALPSRPPERVLDREAIDVAQEFAHRHESLGPKLRRELAEQALPIYVLEPERVRDPEETLLAVARWCAGRRT